MDFETRGTFVIPFIIQETSVWKEVLQYLAEKETTPVEAICNSRIISISKEYYPVERLDIDYTAKWNAISIFIKRWTEQETHYERQVHYFDRFGQEHDGPGFDYYDAKAGRWKSGSVHFIQSRIKGYSGDAGTRPWDPREVTVAVTEDISYEKETGRQRNSGEVTGTYGYYHDKEFPFPMLLEQSNDPIFNSVEEKKIPYSNAAVQDGTVIELLHSPDCSLIYESRHLSRVSGFFYYENTPVGGHSKAL